jgi:predicted Zn finger-like uncharacterized protein
MFTRCPACNTVFHITAAELRAADGTVICGACDATFDALDSLSETRPAEVVADEGADPADRAPGEAVQEAGEDARDEDEFLEEIESLIGNEDLTGEAPRGSGLQQPGLPPQQGPGRVVPDAITDEDLDDQIPDPDSVFRVDDLPKEYLATSTAPSVGTAADPEPPAPQAPPSSISGEAACSGEAVPPQSATAAYAQPTADPESTESMPGFVQEIRRGGPWLRVTATVVAMLVLAGTWAHVQRGKLLREPAGEAVLGPIYALLRIDAAPDWKPGEFRVLRSEAIANADYRGDLRVAVEFLNAATFAQPYPVIRIVLQDRFGQRLGMHDVGPERYLDGYSSGARLAAGERMRTSVAVPDPGERADGFRVDLCLEMAARGLVCAPEPFR